jgi:hypothetical protein
MARPRQSKTEKAKAGYIAEVVQAPLIPMSDEEMREAGQNIARKVKDLAELKAQNDEERKQMRSAVHKLEAEIEAIASTIRNSGR